MNFKKTGSKKITIKGFLTFTFILLSIPNMAAEQKSPIDILLQFEKILQKKIYAVKTPVMALVDGQKIYKKMFDMQLDMLLKYSGKQMSAKERKIKKTDRKFLKDFLRTLISYKLILNDINSDKRLKNNTEFMLYMYSSMLDAVQKYYLHKKADLNSNRINKKITEKEIADYYNRLKLNPKFKNVLNKTPLSKIKKIIKRQIIQRRQQKMLLQIMDRLKMQSKIIIKSKLLK